MPGFEHTIMPFYVVCDVSGSMQNDIDALNDALNDLHKEIKSNPIVDDLSQLSVLAFSNDCDVVQPLSPAHAIQSIPKLSIAGGTYYGNAFRKIKSTIRADKKNILAQGINYYRPCVFFLTDGEPLDSDFAEVFKECFAYDEETQSGNKSFPYFLPFGFRDAKRDVLEQLRYPNFGKKQGAYYMARDRNGVAEALKAMTGIIGRTMLSSTEAGADAGEPRMEIDTAGVAGVIEVGGVGDYLSDDDDD